jgi:hypothetical protein
MAILPRRAQTDGVTVPDALAREAFLGTLRSELDEDTPLEGAFAELYARFTALRDAFVAGKLEPRSFGRALRDLRVIDGEGFQWTIGATTGRWYRRSVGETNRWMAAPAPLGSGTLVDHTGQEAGWAVENWEERRAKRLEEEAERSKRLEQERATAPETRKQMSIDEMFDRYVENSRDTNSFAVESTILVVDDLPENPGPVAAPAE